MEVRQKEESKEHQIDCEEAAGVKEMSRPESKPFEWVSQRESCLLRKRGGVGWEETEKARADTEH
jgi:hypothetical protein